MSKAGKVLQLTAPGGPFRVVDESVPEPKADEVVFQTEVVGLNPLDWKQMMSGMMLPPFPAVLGLEASGVVEAVGSDVDDIKPGDAIMARCSAGGRAAAYQEYPAVNRMNVAMKPRDLSFEDAASLPVGFYTATVLLYEGLRLSLPSITKEGVYDSTVNRILVIGGSSAVGASAIQLLRIILPNSFIAVICSQPHFAIAKKLGADEAFDSRSANLAEDILSQAKDDQKFDAIIDTVNGIAITPALLDLLSGPQQFIELLTGKNIDAASVPRGVKHSVIFSSMMDGKAYAATVIPSLTKLVDDGKYVPPVKVDIVGHGISELESGLKRLMGGVSGTKFVVKL